jgi:hypothetical protein
MSAWANSLQDCISKNPSQKRAGGVAQGVGPEFKSQHGGGGEEKKESHIVSPQKSTVCDYYIDS